MASAEGPSGRPSSPSQVRARWQAAGRVVANVAQAIKMPVPDPPGTYHANVNGTSIVQNSTGQHTITWKEDLKGADGTVLPAGECNLYRFPRCNIGKRLGVLPEDAQLQLLCDLLVAAAHPQEHIFFRRDPSGACPIHAILIANNMESLSLVLRLYASVPSLLMQTHGPGFFVGESGLHVLAVNRREEELCEALRLADQMLTTPQLVELLCVQAAGDFFRSPPSLFYGGTILGYAAAFNLKEAVRAIMLMDRVASEIDLLNSSSCACKITGFLPLHAAAANGMNDMVDFLVAREPVPAALDGVEPLPEDRRADKNVKTANGEKLVWSGLSTLQLAAKLGDEIMCKHILRTRLSVNWKWGPLTSLSLSLNEIESAYESDAGLMELVAHFEARPSTKAMLLDDFLQGFLHELFVQKWHRFGKYLFYSLRFLDVAFLLLQLVLSFRLKDDPLERNQSLALATLVVGVFCTLYEAWVASLWWRNEFTTSGNYLYKLKGLRAWLSAFGVGRRIVSYTFTIAGCIIYIQSTIAGRANATGKHDEPLWTLFALGASFQTHAVISSFCVSPNFQDLGVYSITIERMFANDVMTFLTFLTFYMLKYWVAMYISFPRAGITTLPEIAPFDDPYKALKAILDAAVYQRRFSTDWNAIDVDSFEAGHWVAITVFSYFHMMFAITCLTLLVRLLMAMMTNTFRSVTEKAQLEWRLLIARNVLRLELVFTAFVKSWAAQCCLPESTLRRKYAGSVPPGGTAMVHTFLHVERSPDAPSSVPVLLAKQGGNDLYDAEEQKAAAALQAKREARVKAARRAPTRAQLPAGSDLIAAMKAAAPSAQVTRGDSSSTNDGTGTSTAHDGEPKLSSLAERSRLREILSAALAILSEDNDSSEASKEKPNAQPAEAPLIPEEPMKKSQKSPAIASSSSQSTSPIAKTLRHLSKATSPVPPAHMKEGAT